MATPQTSTYTYTGGTQTFTVPTIVGNVSVDVRGAGGGTGNPGVNGSPGVGGWGARVQATLAVGAGTVITVYVGGSLSGSFGHGTGGAGGAGGGAGAGAGGVGGASSAVVWTGNSVDAGGGGGGGGGAGDPRSPGAGATGGGGGAQNGGNGSGLGGGGATTSAVGAGGAAFDGASAGASGSGMNGGAGGTGDPNTGGSGYNGGGGGGGGGGIFGGGGATGGGWRAYPGTTYENGGGGGGGGSSSAAGSAVSGVTYSFGYQPFDGTVIFNYTTPDIPSAPTLTAPANNGVADLQGSGGTFSWTFNPTNPGDTQSAYAFRRKIGAGAYTWWRASDSTWQSSETWNTSSAQSIAFAAGLWTNGNVYNWSVATKNSYAQTGAYSSDWIVTAAKPPTVTPSAPVGTTSDPTPVIAWSFSPGTSGDTQSAYRIIVYSAAQYGAGGFVPGSGPNAWDSGVVASSATSTSVATALANGTTYTAYIQVTEGTVNVNSNWTPGSAFTIAFDAPEQPTLVAVFNAAGNFVALVAEGQDNVLPVDDASFESSVGTWVGNGISSVSQRSGTAQDGSFALDIKATSAGASGAASATGVSGAPVVASQSYWITASFRTLVTARTATLKATWYTSGGASISTSTIGSASDSTSAWTQIASAITSPSTAAFVSIGVSYNTAALNEEHLVDEVGVFPLTVGVGSVPWGRGGLVGLTTMEFEYSDDGVTWNDVRGYGAVAIPAGGSPPQTVGAWDYEVPVGGGRRYRAVVNASVSPGPTAIQSPPSVVSQPGTTTPNYWLRDPIDSTSGIVVNVVAGSLETNIPESIKEFEPVGRQYPVMIADALHGEDGKVELWTNDIVSHNKLVALLSRQRTLLLQSPFGEQWYIRVNQARNIKRPQPGVPATPGTADRYRTVSVSWRNVDKP